MPSRTPNSTIASWVMLIARAIDDYGYDSREMFERAGLDYSLINEPGARYPYSCVCRLWALVESTVADPCLGMRVASLWHPTTLHALGYSWLASYSLDEAFKRTLRFGRILNSAANGAFKIRESDRFYGLVFDTRELQFEPPQVAQEGGLAMFVNISRAAYGPDFKPIGVSLKRKEPDCIDRFVEYFGAPITFGEVHNALWLDPAQVNKPLATANPELVRANDQIIIDYLAHLDRNDVVSQVRAEISERLPGGHIDEAEIASALHMSQRSLQRRLADQSMPFTLVLEDTRRELSREYVRDPQRSINEIAYLLGFSEPGNFSRAFKRWYQQSPIEYRQKSLM
jgi:AraC-like DNA-binding protein